MEMVAHVLTPLPFQLVSGQQIQHVGSSHLVNNIYLVMLHALTS
jgi:hypothetical protein